MRPSEWPDPIEVHHRIRIRRTGRIRDGARTDLLHGHMRRQRRRRRRRRERKQEQKEEKKNNYLLLSV